MEEVLRHALISQPTPIEWEEDAAAIAKHAVGDDDGTGVRAH